MSQVRKFCVVICCLLWAGPGVANASGEKVAVDLLIYRVTEAGSGPYISRILVSDRFMRLDQGMESSGFILFDREMGAIYNISDDDRTVLVIHPAKRAVRKPPYRWHVRRVPAADAPKVGGVQPEHYRFLAGDEVCRDAIVLPGVMGAAVGALRAYRQVLADQEAVTLPGIPDDMRSPCSDALNLYSPEAELGRGLPLRTWDAARREELLDYRTGFEVASTLFILPTGYERLRMGNGL